MGLFRDTVKEIEKQSEIIENPGREQLREFAKHQEKTTEFGSASYITKIKNRSAKFTEIVEKEEEHETILKEVVEFLKGKELVSVQRTMGQSRDFCYQCRTVFPKEHSRIGYMFHTLLFEPQDKEPDTIVVFVPDWKEIKILVHPEEGVTFVLGSDYFGECKKGHLRMCLYYAKKRGYLGLHAASKLVKIKDNKGELQEKGFVIFGLSGTGKTSLTVHDFGLKSPDGVGIVQDDMTIINETAYCHGTENGYFLKTEGLTPDQEVLYAGASSPDSIFENVWVDEDGKIDFTNLSITSNGRGVIPRSAIKESTKDINMEKANFFVFITRRNDVVPPVAKLTPLQAAAAFMLGESIETSAGDPTRAGEPLRVVGTNPFIVGPLHEEGNKFLGILKNNPDIECFVLNTGRVGGEQGDDIKIEDSVAILRAIAQGSICWKQDPHWGYEIPTNVEEVDSKKLNPANYYSKKDYEALVEKLNKEREEYMSKFPKLNAGVVMALVRNHKNEVHKRKD